MHGHREFNCEPVGRWPHACGQRRDDVEPWGKVRVLLWSPVIRSKAIISSSFECRRKKLQKEDIAVHSFTCFLVPESPENHLQNAWESQRTSRQFQLFSERQGKHYLVPRLVKDREREWANLFPGPFEVEDRQTFQSELQCLSIIWLTYLRLLILLFSFSLYPVYSLIFVIVFLRWPEISQNVFHFRMWTSFLANSTSSRDQTIANSWSKSSTRKRKGTMATASLPRVINTKFPLQPHQKIPSHSLENLAFHSLLR